MRTSTRVIVTVVLAATAACRPDATSPTSNERPSRPTFAVIPGSGSWSTETPKPTHRERMTGAALGGLLYAVGGSPGGFCAGQTTFEAYDPGTDTWSSSLTQMPVPLDLHSTAVAGGMLYVFGGEEGTGLGCARSQDLWRYHPGSDAWTNLASLPADGRYVHMSASLGGNVYVFGGQSSTGAFLAETWRYDPSTNGWTLMAPMPRVRVWGAAVRVGGNIYLIGGGGSGFATISEIDVYDASANTWSTATATATLGLAVSGVAMDGIIYVHSTAENPAKLLAYDPVTDVATYVADAPGGIHGGAAGVVNGTAYFTSGAHGTPTYAFTPAFAGNHRPVVAVLPAQTLLEGESYVVAGSFTDPDEGPWTSTVDWGEGGGQAALPNAAMAFALNHVYATRGDYDLRVRVDDSEGLRGIRSALVSVRSVRWGLGQLASDVAAAGLGAGDEARLTHWITKATTRYRAGDRPAFGRRMDDFRDEVDELVGEAALTAGQGNALKAFALRLKNAFD